MVSISVAGVSAARVTIAETDLRSLVPGPLERMRTLSMFRGDGVKRPFMTAGEVPDGRDERCNVGLAAALSSTASLASSSRASESGSFRESRSLPSL